jgi:methyl-accepting chemotaxis protein/CHASE3 domain sensor protein
MSIMTRFNNLRIRARVLSGFSLILTILLTVGAAEWMVLDHIHVATDEGAHRSGVTAAAAEIELRFAVVRRFAREFGLTGEAATARRADDALARTREDLANAEALVVRPDRKARLHHIEEKVNAYAADFERVKTAVRDIRQLQTQELDPTGQKLHTGLASMADAAQNGGQVEAELRIYATLDTLMTARLDANKALGRHDPELVNHANVSLAALHDVIIGLDSMVHATPLAGPYAELPKLADTYGTAFHRGMELRKQIDELVNGTMAAAGEQIGQDAETIKDTSAAEQAASAAAIDSVIRQSRWVGGGLTAVGLVLGGLLAWLIGSSIVRPVQGMTAAMRRLAEGDTAIDVPGLERHDEVGAMAAALQVFKDNRVEADRLAAEQDEARQRRERRTTRMEELTRGFEARISELVGKVSGAATELEATARSMTGVAGQTTEQTASVAAAAEQASVNVQAVATAAEELSSSIIEISRQVAQSTQLTGKAVEEARHTDSVVQALADGAQKIGEVVSLISNIAGQTNLLALNATIEAARAGDAGKGFAVVASEVKSLATQTAKATDDIARQVTQIQTATKEAVASIQGIGARIGEVSEIATAIAAAMEEQGAATQEIARNVQQAAAGTQEVTTHISGVAEGANSTGAAATQVLGAASELAMQSEHLSSEVGHFVTDIKAA